MGTPSKDKVPQKISKANPSKGALKLYKSKGNSTTTTIEPQKSKGGPTKDKVPLKSNSSPIKEKTYASSGTPSKDKTLKNIQPKDSKGNKKSNVKRPILIVPTKSGFKSQGPVDEESHPTKKLKLFPTILLKEDFNFDDGEGSN
jgi:hypothetical protein